MMKINSAFTCSLFIAALAFASLASSGVQAADDEKPFACKVTDNTSWIPVPYPGTYYAAARNAEEAAAKVIATFPNPEKLSAVCVPDDRKK